jgi:hypothetical protein
MISKLKLFDEKVERDLELENVSSNIIGVCQVQKRNEERKEREEKENQIKEVRGY